MIAPPTQERARAILVELGIDVASWPEPSPEQIERLRALFGYTSCPA